MRNIFEKSTFKGIISWIFVCCLFWIVVFADRNVKSFRDNWNTETLDYKLTSDNWDNLLKEIDKLKNEMKTALNQPSIRIPTWTIFAFDWKSWCPTWWTLYSGAGWRTLLWVINANQAMVTGWSTTATLKVENIPAHTHYLKDTMFSEAFLEAYRNNFMRGEYMSDFWNKYTYKLFSAWVRDIPWKYPAWWSYQEAEWVIFGQEDDVDYDNYPIYWVRVTSSEACSIELWNNVNTYWYNLNWNLTISNDKVAWSFLNFKWTALSSKVRNYCYWTTQGQNTQSFSIQDPYLTVVYCMKTED